MSASAYWYDERSLVLIALATRIEDDCMRLRLGHVFHLPPVAFMWADKFKGCNGP